MMMLSWIAFRAETLSVALRLYAKVIQPSRYTFLGMRENVYLVAALLTGAVTIAYFVKRSAPLLSPRPLVRAVLESCVSAVMVGLVFVFLRPITQFIYFQF